MSENKIRAAVVTVSDRSSKGEREDISGPVLKDELVSRGAEVAAYEIVPDVRADISTTIVKLADELKVDLILTTGGTGLAPRDVTPEATLDVIERSIPGIVEAMRTESILITPHGMLSRAVAGSRGETMIVNMPGSPKAARESLEIIWPAIPHAVDLLHGRGLEDHNPKGFKPGKHHEKGGHQHTHRHQASDHHHH